MNYSLTKKEIVEISENLKDMKRKGNISPGDFGFIIDSLEQTKTRKTHLQSFYEAIDKTENGWEFLRNVNPPNHLGYLKWKHPILENIYVNVKYINEMSDIVIACYFREMKEIAINGWYIWYIKELDEYIKKCNKEIFLLS